MGYLGKSGQKGKVMINWKGIIMREYKNDKQIIEETKLQIESALKILGFKEEPDIRILKQCSTPYTCPLKDYCWKDIPENLLNVKFHFFEAATGKDLHHWDITTGRLQLHIAFIKLSAS